MSRKTLYLNHVGGGGWGGGGPYQAISFLIHFWNFSSYEHPEHSLLSLCCLFDLLSHNSVTKTIVNMVVI